MVAKSHGLSTVVRLQCNPLHGGLDAHQGGRLEGGPVQDNGRGHLGAALVNPQLSAGDDSPSLVPSRGDVLSLVAAAPSRGR